MTASLVPIPLRLPKLVVCSDVQPSHILSLSSGPRIKFLQEPSRSRFKRLKCFHFLFVSAFHANNKAWSGQHEVQRNSATGAKSHE